MKLYRVVNPGLITKYFESSSEAVHYNESARASGKVTRVEVPTGNRAFLCTWLNKERGAYDETT